MLRKGRSVDEPQPRSMRQAQQSHTLGVKGCEYELVPASLNRERAYIGPSACIPNEIALPQLSVILERLSLVKTVDL